MADLYTLCGVCKRFGEREVLHIDKLSIESGKIYALLGPNGAGKSTLMRILAFLDAPTAGTLHFKGERVPTGFEARFRPGVVWVPQFPVMFTGTLFYNVEYPMVLKRVPGAERRKRALDLLETVNLAHLAGSPAPRLSGGEAQRASIARALAAGAEIILFDEPTANVDQRSLGDFTALVRGLKEREGLSILITTHNATLAAELCEKRIVLSEGKLVRGHVLPGGGVAWPARLAEDAGAFSVWLAPEPHAALAAPKATVEGVSRLAAGIVLRLASPEGRSLEVLLADGESGTLAHTLTLGQELNICRDPAPAPEPCV